MNQGRSGRSGTPRVRRAEPVWEQRAHQPERWFDRINEDTYRDQEESFPEQASMADESAWKPEPSLRRSEAEQPERIATNTAIRLACTLCAMMSPLAAFMCYAERESYAIRHYAVQSVAVLVAHGMLAALLLATGTLMSGIPYMGFLVQLLCWLTYFAVVMSLLILRVRMMLHAWRGQRHKLPLIGAFLEKLIDGASRENRN